MQIRRMWWAAAAGLGLLVMLSACPLEASPVSVADDVAEGLINAKKWSGAGRPIKLLSAKDLDLGSEADNVLNLLGVAVDELRLSDSQATRLRPVYESFDSGDQLLLVCLKSAQCNPESFASIARISSLHAEVVARRPDLNAAQVNQQVGAVAERLMDRFYKDGGWQRIEGQVGRNGIDGLYAKYESGVIKDVMVVESKYNTSTLKETNYGTQMSETWMLRKMEELRAEYPDESAYGQIERFLNAGVYRAELWNLKVEGNVIRVRLDKLKAKGTEVELAGPEAIVGSNAVPVNIDIDRPKNEFQRRFVQWYQAELNQIGPLPILKTAAD